MTHRKSAVSLHTYNEETKFLTPTQLTTATTCNALTLAMIYFSCFCKIFILPATSSLQLQHLFDVADRERRGQHVELCTNHIKCLRRKEEQE